MTPLAGTPAPPPYELLATVTRNGFVESRHVGAMVVLGADGGIRAALGDPTAPILPRSSVKPLQALAMLRAGAPLAGAGLALAAASHSGQDEHVRTVRGILAAAGLDESALGCPPDEPSDPATRRRLIAAGTGPARVRMNCSGKHAAMLSACVAAGWPTATYLDPAHPLQRLVAETITERAGEEIAHVAVDGCGAPLYGLSLVGLARGVRSLVTDTPGSPGRAVADAMRAHPVFVAGTGRPNTVVMQAIDGLLCKGGAEGVLVAAAASGEAVAIKAADGSPRATTPVLLAALAALGIDLGAAAALRTVPVTGGGKPVGEIAAAPQVAARVRAGAGLS